MPGQTMFHINVAWTLKKQSNWIRIAHMIEDQPAAASLQSVSKEQKLGSIFCSKFINRTNMRKQHYGDVEDLRRVHSETRSQSAPLVATVRKQLIVLNI
jgi:hypothetical protein